MGLAFVLLPVAELWVFLQVAHRVHLLAALLLLAGVSACGVAQLRRAGVRAARRVAAALAAGRTPTREATDGAVAVLGGILLTVPGFLTGAVGLLLVLPGPRSLARRALVRLLLRRAQRGRTPLVVRLAARSGPGHHPAAGGTPGREPRPDRPAASAHEGQIIEGEVVRRPGETPPG